MPYPLTGVSWAQLEGGTMTMRLRAVEASPIGASFGSFSLGFKADAAVEPGQSLYGIVADARTRARWFGVKVDQACIVAGSGKIEVSAAGPAAFYWIGLDDRALRRTYGNAPDLEMLRANLEAPTLVRDPLRAATLRRCLQRLFVEEPAAPAIRDAIVCVLAGAAEHLERDWNAPSRPMNRRRRAVRACELYMHEHADSDITLLDLGRISGLRSRSLINAFNAVTGFSPMEYLKRLRLNGVYRALRRADKTGTRIIDVAADWGFWHMGHFTSDYRAMFGETPSNTLLH